MCQRLASYGVTVQWYAEQFAAQDGRCAICRRPEWITGKFGEPKKLAVDHCHGSGRARKLLCQACNTLLGLAEDDVDRLLAAAAYLRSFETEGVA